jgi:polysaccharide deacetylase family protein (PEP-CTERM system associated)
MSKIYFSFDIEDFFMANCFDGELKVSNWENLPNKIEESFEILLEILDEKAIKATMFFLGYIANKYPHLVKKAFEKGHEIATHGYHHRLVYTQTPKDFYKDVSDSVKTLEDLIGVKVLGYRAPSFSLDIKDQRYVDTLIKNGIQYDSSVFPSRSKSKTKHVGNSPFRINNSITEIPMSTQTILKFNFPIGGAFFRFYPKKLNNFIIKKKIVTDNIIFYLHPWELLENHPFYPKNRTLRFKHTFNIGSNCISKLYSIPEIENGLLKDLIIKK